MKKKENNENPEQGFLEGIAGDIEKPTLEQGEGRKPLAERMRPRNLDEFIGQRHLLGEGKALDIIIKSGHLPSLILWGPPGCGKTSLAYILAKIFGYSFHPFSAVVSGIRELKNLFKELESRTTGKNLVFIDEIHRFNKAQQDAFLPYVERGVITLIGTTTLNPSFSIVSPLLSRMRVLILEPLDEGEILELMKKALEDKERGYGTLDIRCEEDLLKVIAEYVEGDARAALNILELMVEAEKHGEAAASEPAGRPVETSRAKGPGERHTVKLTFKRLNEVLQGKIPEYDRDGEGHYNLISALHKSIRGSDPDAALYWLARMLEGGEDPLYIARRLIRVASEDVGLADPNALEITVRAKDAVHFLGMPEGDLALAEAVVYLATSPKSNSIYTAYGRAKEDAHEFSRAPVPMYLRNPVTSLMRKAGYGKGYKYPHDYPGRVVNQDYFPKVMGKRKYYEPSGFGFEKVIGKRIEWWIDKRNKSSKKA